jgi:hypothetical protein
VEGTADLEQLNGLVARLKTGRQKHEAQWKVNDSFMRGDHYVSFNKRTGRVDKLETDSGRVRTRLTCNQIRPLITRRIAKMTKNSPTFVGIPATSDASDVKASRIGKILFEDAWDKFRLGPRVDEALHWAHKAASGYWHIYWNSEAGKPIEYMIDPETDEIVVDNQREEALRMQAAATGEDLNMKTMYEGDIAYEVLSPFELHLIGGKEPEDAHTAFVERAYDPKYLRERWLKPGDDDVEPDGNTAVEGSLPGLNDNSGDDNNAVIVWTMYVKPTPKVPKGKYVVWCKDRKLEEGPYPYKHGELPFTRFAGEPDVGSPYDHAIITDLIHLNRELNRTISQWLEQRNMSSAKMIAPEGSLTSAWTNAPGEIKTYNPVLGKPEFMSGAPPQGDYIALIENILQRMNDIAGQQEISQGRMPTNIESGVAIGMLQEQDDTGLYPRIKQMEYAISRAGYLHLELAKEFYEEERLVQMTGSSGLYMTRQFKNSDLGGCKDVKVVSGSTIPRLQAEQNAFIDGWVTQGKLDPMDGLRMMQLGVGMDQILEEEDIDRRKQEREIEAALRGEEMPEVRDKVDNHEHHVEILLEFIKSEEFESSADDVQVKVLAHFDEHQVFLSEMPTPPSEKLSVIYNIKDDGTSSSTGDVLERMGYTIRPELMAKEKAHEAMMEGQSKVMMFEKQREMNFEEQQIKEQEKLNEKAAAEGGVPPNQVPRGERSLDPLGEPQAEELIREAGESAAALLAEQPEEGSAPPEGMEGEMPPEEMEGQMPLEGMGEEMPMEEMGMGEEMPPEGMEEEMMEPGMEGEMPMEEEIPMEGMEEEEPIDDEEFDDADIRQFLAEIDEDPELADEMQDPNFVEMIRKLKERWGV